MTWVVARVQQDNPARKRRKAAGISDATAA
jgi:hypothetical protein